MGMPLENVNFLIIISLYTWNLSYAEIGLINSVNRCIDNLVGQR
jgi:hypothetical protein